MNKLTAIAILLAAAALEAGGDTLMRMGIKQSTGASRLLFLAAGAIVLTAYGATVNAPDWDFGRLLGLYVVFFFLIAQAMSWVFFNQPPSTATLVGGLLIVAGGAVIGAANS
jgi:hypothetical protein